ncbi:MAG: carboxynorspermidine decarboxylase [Alphaproteobacteria bacterium]
MSKIFYVYLITNFKNTALYTGVTSDLEKRVFEHKNGTYEGFTKKYNCTKLVYFEVYSDSENAIRREKEIKGWVRKKKNSLINTKNPEWTDISECEYQFPTDSSAIHQNDMIISCHPEDHEGSEKDSSLTLFLKKGKDMFNEIKPPSYIADIAAIRSNLTKAKRIREEAGVEILLATKAFSMFSIFPMMAEYLDGTTASGLYEARLGATHFGKNVHTYSPAFTENDLTEILKYSNHIYFNSVPQLNRFAPMVRERCKDAVIGLRVNPRLSLVKNSALYDPSAPCSRFGVQKEELTPEVLKQVDILHFHNLCENMAQESLKLITHVSTEFGFALDKVSRVNLGGGHFYSHPDYDIAALIAALKALKSDHDVDITLEPGAAHVLNGGYLAATVLDVIEQGEHKIAILDASASTHMPDVLEVPYTPEIIGATITEQDAIGENTYILGGNTCMTGDVIGTYKFDAPLEIGQKLLFTDMMQYANVKNTTFNGVPLPDIAILHEDGRYEVVKSFGYEDFEERLS